MSARLLDAAACGAFRALHFLLRLLPVRFILDWPCPFLLQPVAQLLLGRRARSTLQAALAGLHERGCRPGILDKLVQESSLHMARALALFLRLPVEETELREMVTLDRESGEELSKDLAAGGCVLVSAHFGAFELIIPALVALLPTSFEGKEIVVPFKPLHLGNLNKLVLEHRGQISAGRCSFVPAKGSMPLLETTLASGGVVGMLPDQRGASHHPCLPFLGRDCRYACLSRDGARLLFVSAPVPHFIPSVAKPTRTRGKGTCKNVDYHGIL